MSNSPLISYSKISPNRTAPRNHAIDTITIHCMAGQLSVETCGKVFAPKSRQASSNYGIGPDGRIGMYVEEADRSWCSSSAANDNRAITIEVASDKSEPYAVTAEAYQSLIKLCADICRRNGISKLVWATDKTERVQHLNGCNMTVHRDFSTKSCPGEYLYNRHADIAAQVNALLGTGSTENLTYVGTGIGSATAREQMEVRAAAKVSARSLGHVNAGQKVEVIDVLASGWMKIVWPGSMAGYGFTSNAGGAYYDYTPATWVGIVTADLLNVRTGPSAYHPNLPSYPKLGKGNRVDVIGSQSGWYQIRIAGRFVGWVKSDYISRA